MTHRTISDADLAALVAVRSVIADAQHPGREAAIAALDRLAAPADCCRLRVDGEHVWCPVQPGFVTDLGGYAELVRRGIGECCKLCGAARPGSVPAPKLIDFVEAAWPALHPDQCFERTPVVETMCEWIDQLGGDAESTRGARVSFERGKRVTRRDPDRTGRLIVDDPNVAQPTGAVADLLAGIAQLYGLDRITLDYDESVSVWCVRGTLHGRVRQKQITDRDIVDALAPTAPWFHAIRELAIDLGVSDTKDAQLVELLTRPA